MEKSDIKKLIPIMQAVLRDEDIQMKYPNSPDWEKFELTKESSFYGNVEYKITNEDTYIPFDITDSEVIIGKPVKHKDVQKECYIISATSSQIVTVGPYKMGYSDLLRNFRFLNGCPCGKLPILIEVS